MNQIARHPDLESFDPLVGEWSTKMTHPSLPSLEVSGTSTFEWLSGRHFLTGRSVTDHPDFPDGLTVLADDGDDDSLAIHYYDSRGVQRIYRSSRIEGGVWKMWRDDPDFSHEVSDQNGRGDAVLLGRGRGRGGGLAVSRVVDHGDDAALAQPAR